MKKPYSKPLSTEHLIIRRRPHNPDRKRGREREEVAAAAAVQLFDFVRRNLDDARFPALTRAIDILANADRVPETLQGLAKRTGVSRTNLWRESHAFGLHGVPTIAMLRAGLVWRISALMRSGVELNDALRTVGVQERTYRAAVALVTRSLERAWAATGCNPAAR